MSQANTSIPESQMQTGDSESPELEYRPPQTQRAADEDSAFLTQFDTQVGGQGLQFSRSQE